VIDALLTAVTEIYRELEIGFRADIIVEGALLLELKSVDRLTPAHLAQVITYLKLLHFRGGLLLNFNQPLMKDGIQAAAVAADPAEAERGSRGGGEAL